MKKCLSFTTKYCDDNKWAAPSSNDFQLFSLVLTRNLKRIILVGRQHLIAWLEMKGANVPHTILHITKSKFLCTDYGHQMKA